MYICIVILYVIASYCEARWLYKCFCFASVLCKKEIFSPLSVIIKNYMVLHLL